MLRLGTAFRQPSLDRAVSSGIRVSHCTPPAAGRMPRVRAAMEFLVELFKDIEKRCVGSVGGRPLGSAPAWVGPRPYRRASTAAAQRNR